MIACALIAAPKFRPPAGTPPITPGSAVSVIRSAMLLLGGDRGDALGHADAEVDDAVGLQLQRGAARDDLALARARSGSASRRRARASRRRRRRCRRCAKVCRWSRGVGDDHAVDQDAGDLDLARVQRAALGDALDLHDHQAAAVVRRHRDRQRLERQRLALHRDVAVGIGGGAAHDARRRSGTPCRTGTPRRRSASARPGRRWCAR